jgi:DNA (cytosine-5)-methyltransferase 1
MNHIELFAGCGGLSLGLESEGFELILANELSPMASETFAYNHLELELNPDEDWDNPKANIHWISSQFPRYDLASRLKENPNEALASAQGIYSDLKDTKLNLDNLRRSILVGSITELNQILEQDKGLLRKIRNGLGDKEVDLVSGGPPCQSFSLAGLRQRANKRNSLPWAFAEFVRLTQPKMALLENVSGILRPFKEEGGLYYAWFEVAKAFAQEGYVPLCLHVNAKYAGAAQNRPRFIMLSFRHDIAKKVAKSNGLETELLQALSQSLTFYSKVRKNPNVAFVELDYYDIEKNPSFFESKILSPLVAHRNNIVSVESAIGDLHTNKPKSRYVKNINNVAFRDMKGMNNPIPNHELRNNNLTVQARFRLYQLMNELPQNSKKEISNYLGSGKGELLSDASIKELTNSGWIINTNGELVTNLSRVNILAELLLMSTKKRTQKALVRGLPAPAALSIPDDACHYDENELRTLTVREMARIQSFPDWFEFRSKVTTGGHMRRFQVPQYTQVGNAVPPLLGKALGKVCRQLLALSN